MCNALYEECVAFRSVLYETIYNERWQADWIRFRTTSDVMHTNAQTNKTMMVANTSHLQPF